MAKVKYRIFPACYILIAGEKGQESFNLLRDLSLMLGSEKGREDFPGVEPPVGVEAQDGVCGRFMSRPSAKRLEVWLREKGAELDLDLKPEP